MKENAIESHDLSLEEVMSFIESQLIKEIKPREIRVFSGRNWDYLLLPSVSKFLFEDLNIIDNFAPLGQINRPGKKYKKHYICVHDTGDPSFGAYQWSEIVRRSKIGKSNRDYICSFQYVVGNDGYYHNIPDDEMARHAGDGHSEESLFGVIPTGIYVDKEKINKDEKPKIEIDIEGYYTINGEKSKIKAPTNDKNEILTTKDINDLSIYSELQKIDENKYEYYIGRTWYNPEFKLISNYGGNLNSIGIECCVNTNTDVYYSWQKVAKLVAKLMDENNFGIDAVVQHHYFSGKNCPQTTRMANLWEYFKDLVLVEYQMLYFKKNGYNFEFKSENEKLLNENGRIIDKVDNPTKVNYSIKITDKNGKSINKSFNSLILPK